MNTFNQSNENIDKYIAYLNRYVKVKGISLHDAHRLYINREVGRMYGLSDKDLARLDVTL